MAKFLVLYRGGDGSKLSPKENERLMKKWGTYMEKLVKSGAFVDGAPVQSSAATQIVGKAKAVKAKRAGNHASFVGGYCILEGKSVKGIQRLSLTCPHLTVADGTIEIIPAETLMPFERPKDDHQSRSSTIMTHAIMTNAKPMLLIRLFNNERCAL